MIKFVYFDLGGVVDLDFSKTNKYDEMKTAIGVSPSQSQRFDNWFDNIESDLCIGKIDFDLEYENIKLTLANFVDRFYPNPSIYPIIDIIHQNCKIGLLTNMYPGMYNSILDKKIIPDINWDIVIDSSVVGLEKPDPKIYKLAEELAGVGGSEILFVENTLKNIEMAKNFDWQTFLYDPSNPEKSSQDLLKWFDEKIKS